MCTCVRIIHTYEWHTGGLSICELAANAWHKKKQSFGSIYRKIHLEMLATLLTAKNQRRTMTLLCSVLLCALFLSFIVQTNSETCLRWPSSSNWPIHKKKIVFFLQFMCGVCYIFVAVSFPFHSCYPAIQTETQQIKVYTEHTNTRTHTFCCMVSSVQKNIFALDLADWGGHSVDVVIVVVVSKYL